MKDEKIETKVINNHTNELPSMRLKVTQSTNDFITEEMDLFVSGYSIDECKESMDYLLNRSGGLKDGRRR